MDLYKQYKQNPLKFDRVLTLPVTNQCEFTKVRNEIILKTYQSHQLVYMSGVTPTKYPVTAICIPYGVNKVYLYYEYLEDIKNPLIPELNR